MLLTSVIVIGIRYANTILLTSIAVIGNDPLNTMLLTIVVVIGTGYCKYNVVD